jgi:hypothetical protein
MALHRDDALTARYPEGIPNRLVLTTRDGRTLTKEVTYPRGHARNPMTDAEVKEKYAAWARRALPGERIAPVAELAWRLDVVADLGEVGRALMMEGSTPGPLGGGALWAPHLCRHVRKVRCKGHAGKDAGPRGHPLPEGPTPDHAAR